MADELPQPTPEQLGAILRGEPAPAEDEDLDNGADEAQEGADDAMRQEAGDGEAQGEEAESSKADGDEPPDGEATDEPERLTVAGLAEKLGMKASDLYDLLVVPLGENRGDASLDELKKVYGKVSLFEDERDRFELEREQYSSEKHERETLELRNRQEMTMMMRLVEKLPPELIAQAQQAHEQELARNIRALFEAKPEWRDPATYDAAQQSDFEAMAQFGFSRAEFNTITDHRLRLAANRLATLERERADALKAWEKARAEATPEPSKRGRRRTGERGRVQRLTKQAQAPGANNEVKIAAIGEVLKRARRQ